MSVAEQAGARTGEGGPVGAQLARARVAHGFSIDDLQRRTNIRSTVISALERDDIRPSGGVVYARGHLRTLAQALGLDPTPLLAAFDASHGTASPPVLVSDTDAAEVSLRSSGPPATGPRWPLVMAGLLVVVIVIALVQLLVPGSKDKGHSAVKALPAPAKANTLAPKPTAQAPSLVFPVPAEGVTLRIVLTTKPSWLDITDERGAQLIQRVVQPSNQALDLHAAGRLQATIGDASAAAVSCNGHPLGTLGAAKQVVTLTLVRGSTQCPGS
ncbi:MAG TPA: helix-turn-helix domain-containing protein [Frankiaceae bacterium]|nr:helix-turn-helix domain-containing protein [Frankiaceae bacterium]